MQDDKRPLVMELAHILHRRNEIEVRRRRAKSKISYYETMKRMVKKYREDVAALAGTKRTARVLAFQGVSAERVESQCKAAQDRVDQWQHEKMRPFKWLDKASELNKQILKYRAEYMRARYDAARLTCQTRKRVARLTTLLDARINYQFGTGFVSWFAVNASEETAGATVFEAKDFEAMYRETDANKAIEKALRSNGPQAT